MIFKGRHPDIEIPDQPFPEFVFRRVAERGGKTVLADGATGRSWTLRELDEGARRAAVGFARRGLRARDVVAICSPNLPEYALAFHGAARAGGVVTTANPAYTAEELAFQLRDSGARFLVTGPSCLEKAKAAARGTRVEDIFVLGDDAGAEPFQALLREDGDPPALRVDPATDLAALPYSSGTSGRPKGVMLTHRNLVAVSCQVAAVSGIDENWRTLGVLPFFHIYGLMVLMNFPIAFAGYCVTLPRYELAEMLRLVQEHHLTHLYLVPPIVLALAKNPLVDQFDLSSLRQVNSGAAPLDEDLQRACSARLACLVTQGYGMTETSVGCITSSPDPAQLRLGTVGQPLPNLEARVVDVETGTERGPGERGEIWVRGPNITRGYWNNPEASRSLVDADGWLHTGDIGYADDEGYFRVVDRVKELIKYKAMQVAPAELEGLLFSHPAVADAAVIPSPDEEAGEVPKAFVVLRGELSAEALMAWVAQRVAPHKKIRRVEFVESIPRSPSGKILRRILVERERGRR